jgi:hypothetical protein
MKPDTATPQDRQTVMTSLRALPHTCHTGPCTTSQAASRRSPNSVSPGPAKTVEPLFRPVGATACVTVWTFGNALQRRRLRGPATRASRMAWLDGHRRATRTQVEGDRPVGGVTRYSPQARGALQIGQLCADGERLCHAWDAAYGWPRPASRGSHRPPRLPIRADDFPVGPSPAALDYPRAPHPTREGCGCLGWCGSAGCHRRPAYWDR